jgi:hypothetical protein
MVNAHVVQQLSRTVAAELHTHWTTSFGVVRSLPRKQALAQQHEPIIRAVHHRWMRECGTCTTYPDWH